MVDGNRWPSPQYSVCFAPVDGDMSRFVHNFRELNVYKLAKELSHEIFQLTKSFPKEETYSLTDQIRRSSRSVGAQIAEAWGKRRYERHFISKLTDADAEQLETQHWLETAHDCGYVSSKQTDQLLQQYQSIGRMLGSMISKSSMFCHQDTKMFSEPSPEYNVETQKIDFATGDN